MIRGFLRRLFGKSRWEIEADEVLNPHRHPLLPATATEEEKRRFFDAGMKRCVRCDNEVSKRTHGRNARADGDGYGYDRFACLECPFAVDFAWDEAGTGPHYYEMS